MNHVNTARAFLDNQLDGSANFSAIFLICIIYPHIRLDRDAGCLLGFSFIDHKRELARDVR